MGRSHDNIMKSMGSMKSAIFDAFRRAIQCHWTHDQLLEWRTEWVFKPPVHSRIPQWAQHELQGFWDALMMNIWRNHVVFTYLIDGQRFALGTPEYRAIPVETVAANIETGAFAWKDDIRRLFTKTGQERVDEKRGGLHEGDAGGDGTPCASASVG